MTHPRPHPARALSARALRAVAAALVALPAAGCNDVLTEPPESIIAPENFYRTREDALAAVNGVYVELGTRSTINRHFNIMTDGVADDLAVTQGADRIALDLYRHAAQNEVTDEVWSGYYRGINRANAAIDNVAKMSIDVALRDRLVAEARFLRAMYYFNLVRWFGDLPLLLSETKSLDGLAVARSPEAEVYAQIEADLRAAIATLPATYPAADDGRATRGAAQALLATVLLTRRDYAGAREQLEAVTASGQYSLFPTYAAVFDVANENRREHIFMIQHKQGTPRAAGYMTSFYPVASTLGFATFTPTTGPTGIYDAYEPGDQRRALYIPAGVNHTDPLGRTFRPTQPHVLKYFDADGARSDQDNNFPLLRYADVLLMHAEVLNEIGGPSAAAYGAVNQVRRRAGLADLPAGRTQAQFRDAVLRERRVELAFEGHRWFDLKRTGRLIPTMQAHLDALRAGTTVQPHHVLYPIPQRELDVNSALVQNPGY